MNWSALADAIRAINTLTWALVLAIWHTTLLAIGVWALLRIRQGGSPARRHRLAFAALVAAAVLVAGSWWGLGQVARAVPVSAQSAPQGSSAPRSTGVLPPSASNRSAGARRAQRAGFVDDTATVAGVVVPWLGVAWLITVGVLVIRLAGGALLTLSIRRRATPLESGPVVEATDDVAGRIELRRSIRVAVSPDIDVPATAGWRRTVLLVPQDLDATLSRHQLESVVAHELEHVRLGDRWLVVAQAVIHTTFFFCPGVRWLSQQVRDAREQQCDDAAVRVCGDRNAYATALGVLASRATSSWRAAALGQQAPSLAGRVRRILKGETTLVISRVQAVGLAIGIVVTLTTGAFVCAVSIEDVHLSAGRSPRRSALPFGQASAIRRVATGFVMSQPGSPVTLLQATGDRDFAFTYVRLRNVSDRQIAAVTVLAVVERAAYDGPAILVSSVAAPLALSPGETGEIGVQLLPLKDILEWKQARGTRAQAFLGVLRVSFVDGEEWVITPPSGAKTDEEVFHLSRPSLSRAMVADRSQPERPGATCRDDKGFEYSESAVVAIQGESARARCAGGLWVEQKAAAPSVPPKSSMLKDASVQGAIDARRHRADGSSVQ